MKTYYVFIYLLCGLTAGLYAQSSPIEHLYPIDGSHSFVQFEVTYMGYAKVRGNFGTFYGAIHYDPAAPDRTSVTFQIDVASIDTDSDWRDRDLQSDNWFSAEAYPHIHFSSTSVKPAGEGYLVTGDLSIKSTTKSIEFRIAPPIGVIEDIRGDDQVIFVGEYTLNRKEYGVMGKNWSLVKEGIAGVADEVTIEFSLLGKQVNAENYANFLRNPKRPPGSVYAAYQTEGVAGALNRYETLRADTTLAMNARTLNMVGYMLMMQEKYADARVLFERNRDDFPAEGNVYDSLGELYAKTGHPELSAEAYRKSLALDPKNMNAVEALRLLRRR